MRKRLAPMTGVPHGWSGDGYDRREKVILLSSFFIVRAPGSVGAFWVVTCTAPIPFTVITEEYVHS